MEASTDRSRIGKTLTHGQSLVDRQRVRQDEVTADLVSV
jgi:hypothetical protein